MNEGHAAGSTARKTGLIRPASFSRRNGKTSPAKLDPPPVQPTIRSGRVAGRLELLDGLLADHGLVQQHVVEHAAQRVPGAAGSPPATSTASLIAMPRLPGDSGSSASTALPDGGQVREGLGCTVAP